MSRFTAAERAAIVRGALDACATSGELRDTLVPLRIEAAGLRHRATSLRNRARSLRDSRSG